MGIMHEFRPTLGPRKVPTSMLALAVAREPSVLDPEFDSPVLGIVVCCPTSSIFSAAPLRSLPGV